MKFKKITVKLHTSSHSDDYTILATVKNSAAAKRARRGAVKMIRRKMGKGYCDWILSHAESRRDKMLITIHSNEFPHAFVKYLQKLKSIKQAYWCKSEYLRATLSLPHGTSIAAAPMVLSPEQTLVFAYLFKNGRATMRQTPKRQKVMFTYTEHSYHARRKHVIMLGPLDGINLSLKWKDWHVSRVPDRIREVHEKTRLFNTDGGEKKLAKINCNI